MYAGFANRDGQPSAHKSPRPRSEARVKDADRREAPRAARSVLDRRASEGQHLTRPKGDAWLTVACWPARVCQEPTCQTDNLKIVELLTAFRRWANYLAEWQPGAIAILALMQASEEMSVDGIQGSRWI
jgi:hypothetical protein